LTNVNAMIDAINLQSTFSGVKAALAAGDADNIVLTENDGRNIVVEIASATNSQGIYNIFADVDNYSTTDGIFGAYTHVGGSLSTALSLGTYINSSGGFSAYYLAFSAGSGYSSGSGYSNSLSQMASTFSSGVIRTGAVQLRSSDDIVITGTNVSQSLGFSSQTIQVSNTTALNSVDVSTQSGASDALAVVDSVIRKLTDLRAGLGAIQSRLTTSVANLSITSENLSAAQSQIRDADIAVETAELTRAQILQQAGIAVLAQANTSSQAALQLLKF
jgi:flagellin